MFSNFQKLFTTDVCCLFISVFGVNEKFNDMIKEVANSPRVFQYGSFALKIFSFEPEDLKNKIVNCLQKIGKIGILFIINFISLSALHDALFENCERRDAVES